MKRRASFVVAAPRAAALAALATLAVSGGVARAETPVRVSSSDEGTDIYLAPGDVQGDVIPDPFKKVGVAGRGEGLELKLAPGTYTIETQSSSSSTGHTSFNFLEQPLHVDVKNGNAMVKTTGGILMGLGIVSAIAGVIVLVSLPNSTEHVNKGALGGALIGGGLGGFALGLGLSLAGRTVVTVEPVAR